MLEDPVFPDGVVAKRKFAPGQSLSEEELKAFVRDCKTTADFEASLADYLPDIPPFELKIWHAGLQMNDRGIPVSRSCLNSRIEAAEQEIKALKEEFKAVTGIKNPMNDGAFLNFVRAYGITLKSLSATHLEKTVLTLPDGISRRMLEIRCRIAQLRLCDCKSILPLLNRESRIQGIWEHYGTPACEWTHKYIAGLDLLSGIVCNPSNRLLHSIKIQDLEQRVLSYLLENDTLTPGWYSRNLLDACKKAVCESGNTFSCGRIKVSCFSRFLKFVLPSRRDLFIYAPRLNEKQDLYCRVKSGRQMIEKQIGGGYLLALMEAALSRDIMMSVLLNAVEKGFSPILITGNELVLEHAPDESLSDFTASMMRQTPEWSKALSLHVISHAVSSWE